MGAIARAIVSWLTGSVLGSLRATLNKPVTAPAFGLYLITAVADYFVDEDNELVEDVVRGVEASSLAVAVTEAISIKERQVELWEPANEEVMVG